jgi:hypothetical protein
LRSRARLVLLALLLGWVIWGLARWLAEPAAPDAGSASRERPAKAQDEARAPGLVAPDAARASPQPRHDGAATPAPRAASAPEVVLRVLGPDGVPATGALVQWHKDGGSGLGSAFVDAQGRAHARGLDPARTYRLQVSPWYPGSAARPYDDPAWHPASGTIRLEAGLTVSGRVVDEDGRPITDGGVFCRTLAWDGSSRRLQVDARGAFVARHLPPGRVQVCAVFNDPWQPRAPLGFGAGDVPDGPAAVTAEAGTRDVVLRVRRGAVLRVQVTGWDAAAKPYGRVARLVRSRAGDGALTAPLDGKGRVAFARLDASARYRLTIYALPGNRLVEADDLRPGDGTRRVALRPGFRLTGHVTAPAGVPGDRIRVQASRGDGDFEGIVDEGTGTYAFQGLPPGRYRVWATAAVLRDGRRVVLRTEAEVEAGERRDLVLGED